MNILINYLEELLISQAYLNMNESDFWKMIKMIDNISNESEYKDIKKLIAFIESRKII